MTTYHMAAGGPIERWQCLACGATGNAPAVHECGIQNNPDGNRFFIDCIEYRDPRPTATVGELVRAHCPERARWGTHQMMLAQKGDRPDVPLASCSAVDLRLTPHLSFVPYATY